MKTLIILGSLLISLILGLIIRVLTKNKPRTELVIWSSLMVVWLCFFIYGLVLVIQQETPLFTKNHLSNELTVISSILFLLLGFLYFLRERKNLFGKDNKS